MATHFDRASPQSVCVRATGRVSETVDTLDDHKMDEISSSFVVLGKSCTQMVKDFASYLELIEHDDLAAAALLQKFDLDCNSYTIADDHAAARFQFTKHCFQQSTIEAHEKM
jgi:hypothetical protein